MAATSTSLSTISIDLSFTLVGLTTVLSYSLATMPTLEMNSTIFSTITIY